MPIIVAIAGSLRAKSYNRMLLHAAVELAPAGATVEAASIKDIPLYDGDLEAVHGSPAPVEALKQHISVRCAVADLDGYFAPIGVFEARFVGYFGTKNRVRRARIHVHFHCLPLVPQSDARRDHWRPGCSRPRERRTGQTFLRTIRL